MEASVCGLGGRHGGCQRHGREKSQAGKKDVAEEHFGKERGVGDTILGVVETKDRGC
jgi:hypothetical protein